MLFVICVVNCLSTLYNVHACIYAYIFECMYVCVYIHVHCIILQLVFVCVCVCVCVCGAKSYYNSQQSFINRSHTIYNVCNMYNIHACYTSMYLYTCLSVCLNA